MPEISRGPLVSKYLPQCDCAFFSLELVFATERLDSGKSLFGLLSKMLDLSCQHFTVEESAISTYLFQKEAAFQNFFVWYRFRNPLVILQPELACQGGGIFFRKSVIATNSLYSRTESGYRQTGLAST